MANCSWKRVQSDVQGKVKLLCPECGNTEYVKTNPNPNRLPVRECQYVFETPEPEPDNVELSTDSYSGDD